MAESFILREALKCGRIVGVRTVRGWRAPSSAQGYDLAAAVDGECWLPSVRPSHQRMARAASYRSWYQRDPDHRRRAKEKVYAWRAKRRAERAAARAARLADPEQARLEAALARDRARALDVLRPAERSRRPPWALRERDALFARETQLGELELA